MAPSSVPGNDSLFLQFSQYVQDNKEEGLDCAGNLAVYLPISKQSEYWTLNKIREIFSSCDLVVDADDIRGNYLQVLSTLVSISPAEDGKHRLHYMNSMTEHHRDDRSLPWNEQLRRVMFDGYDGPKVFNEFREAQWTFCPAIVDSHGPNRMSDRRLDRRQIFPVTADPQLIGGIRPRMEACLKKMHVHAQAHAHLENPQSVPHAVVFKIYPPGMQEPYNDEKQAYRSLQNATDGGNAGILRCIGSFYWLSTNRLRTSVIMLELADHGSLLDIYVKNNPPYIAEDIHAFWNSLLGVVKALEVVHNPKVTNAGYAGVHQDIKPSNIFVFKIPSASNGFAYRLKIGDFGASHFRPVSRYRQDRTGPDRASMRTYGPPELHLNDDVDYRVGPEIDIWALGSTLLEAAVWITFGEHGRLAFQDARKIETSQLPDHNALGRSICFHDGSEVLTAVTGIHDAILRNGRRCDTITPAIVELVLKNALVGFNLRDNAVQLFHKMNNILHRPRSVPHIVLPDTPLPILVPDPGPYELHTPPPVPDVKPAPAPDLENMVPNEVQAPQQDTHTSLEPSATPNNDMTSSLPKVTIDELEQWIKEKKAGSVRSLPGWAAAKKELSGRDIVILVDNSKFMQGYVDSVIKVISALSYLGKDIDRDGLEVVCTSDPGKKARIKSSTAAASFVQQAFKDGQGANCNIEKALEVVLDPVKTGLKQRTSIFGGTFSTRRNPMIRPVSIYILTNGLWDHSPNDVCGADIPIRSLIHAMKQRDVGRTHVSLQFVRFGSDARGIKRLDILDDELPKRLGNENYDIVDHKSIESSIWEILIGSISGWTDRASHS